MEAFIGGMGLLLDPKILLVVFLGTVIGIVVGALPGISGSTTTALLLPFTITMGPVPAIAFLGAIYCAANFGGSITAILVNSPGDPSASAAAFDGYPMAVRGEAGRALGMSAVASAIGGIFSVVVLIFAAPLLARMAYSFGPPEYFALAVFGLSMVAMSGGESALKNLIAGAFGVMLATVGQDITTGVERYTFGIYSFSDGIEFIPVLIGLFALTELLEQAAQLGKRTALAKLSAVRLPSWADVRHCGKAISLSSVLGTFIGVLPALGATTAAMIAYVETKRWSKNKQEFGKGAIEGVAGPEAANNAAVGGAMVPTLALGIPGSGTTAMILGVMIMVGLRPGPMLFEQQPDFLGALFAAMLVANVVFLFIGVLLAKWFARISLVDDSYLWPAIGVFCVIGAYTFSNSVVDLMVMLIASVVGLIMRLRGFSLAPVVIGVVLGELLEESLKQSYIIFEGNLWLFFERGICIFFFLLSVGAFLFPLVRRLLQWWRRPMPQEA